MADYLNRLTKEELKENKVIINESGDVEILLTEEAQKLGHVPVEEAKRLAKQYARLLIYGNMNTTIKE